MVGIDSIVRKSTLFYILWKPNILYIYCVHFERVTRIILPQVHLFLTTRIFQLAIMMILDVTSGRSARE